MTPIARTLLSLAVRLAITLFAFWWVLRSVDLASLRAVLASVNPFWLWVTVGIFTLAQAGCIARWRVLVPSHPGLRWPFLANSFLVAQFFNLVLPTTVGGDAIRGYDLIKATGEWRGSLASILADRLIGLVGFLGFALIAWFTLPAAREDPLVRTSFLAFCGLVGVTFGVLGSRRVLHAMLRPFDRIGLGQLPSHAKQFQEALRAYLRQPGRLLTAFGITASIQILSILMFLSASRAIGLSVPVLYLALVVPMILTIAQVPVSLNGWGVREWATVQFLARAQVGRAEALTLSLICAAIPLLSGLVGAGLFLMRRKRKPR